MRRPLTPCLFAVVVAPFLVTISASICRTETPVASRMKQVVTIDQLNADFTILGIVGEPVGDLVQLRGYLKEIKEKPGNYLAIESVNGMPFKLVIPRHLIVGELPEEKLGTRFTFAARATLEFHLPSSEFNPHCGCYSRLVVEK